MKRRDILFCLVGLFLPTAGCQEDGLPGGSDGQSTDTPLDDESSTAGGQSDADEDTETAVYSGTDCPPTGRITAYLPASVPDDVSVRDADRDGYLRNQYLSGLLYGAERRPPDGLEGNRTEDVRIFSVMDEDIAAERDEIREIMGGRLSSYVEYSGVTYYLVYLDIAC